MSSLKGCVVSLEWKCYVESREGYLGDDGVFD